MLRGYFPDLNSYEVFPLVKEPKARRLLPVHNEELWRNEWDSQLPTA